MLRPLSGRARRRILALVDFGLIIIAVLLASLVKSTSYLSPLWWLFAKIALTSLVLQLSFYYNNLYDLKATHSSIRLTYNLIHSFAVAALILGGVYFLIPGLIIARGVFFLSIAFVVILVFPWRYLYVQILRHRGIADNIIIMGTNGAATEIGKEVLQRSRLGYNLVGFWTGNGKTPAVPDRVAVLSGTKAQLLEWMRARHVNTVVLACGQGEEAASKELLNEIDRLCPDVEVRRGSEFYEEVAGKVLLPALTVEDMQRVRNPGRKRFAWHWKRLVDIVISFVGLIVTLPISLITAIAIKLTSRGPVLFTQERVGRHGKTFKLLKFRSMWNNAEGETGPLWAEAKDERITPVGRIIRKFRIDEIPQMINVLGGQMSFVGPRPERPYFVHVLEEQIPFYSHRHCVKPGITGLAQVRHCYTSSIDETVGKLEYDLYYIKQMSSLLDFRILLDSVKTILFGAGAR